jgi:ribonuclease BN (tRNA processing enzyme)
VRVTVVGCSGSVPGPESAASCYLVEADGVDEDGSPRTWRVLLDLGSGALGPLQRYIDPMAVDAVLLSHLHADHCLDVCGLYVMLKHAPGAVPGRSLPVWGPNDTAGRLARAYDLPDPGMAPHIDVSTWVDGRPVRVGPLTVTPYAVNHPVEAYGLRLEQDGRVLAYTGDTDACDGLVPLCRDADLVLADSAYVEGRDGTPGVHLSGRRAAECVVRAGGVRRLVLTHTPPWNDPEVSLAEARQVWDGPLDVARPGATYDV